MNLRPAPRATSRSAPPVKADDGNTALAVVLIAGAALVTGSLVLLVHTKSREIEAGYRIHDLRQQLVTLEHQRTSLEVERAALARPSRVAHIARTALGLIPPRIDTTVAGAAGAPEAP
jgi:cell division protein FtsL